MTDLSLGGETGTGHWGYPAALYNLETHTYEDGGMVWQGKQPPRKKDLKLLKNFPGWQSLKIDMFTVVGTADDEWTTWRDENKNVYPYKQILVV